MRPAAPPRAAPRLRSHQCALLAVFEAMACGGEEGVRDVLAAVTPGGGKSLLPVIAAARLMASGMVERVVWVVPRDSLRLQAEEAFADPVWRERLGHRHSIRAADNGRDPSRGMAGYVTTYQGVAAAPGLHLAEARARPTLVVLDEAHHLPAPEGREGPDDGGADGDSIGLFGGEAPPPEEEPVASEASSWSRALAPLLAAARVRLLLSGTLERADGREILWLPYRRARAGGRVREVALDAPGWRVVGYSRAEALRERAVLPVRFGAMDGEASWSVPDDGGGVGAGPRDRGAADGAGRVVLGPHRLSGPHPTEATRPALFSALRTEFADALLREAFDALVRIRAERRERLGPKAVRGLGKLLVVAPDQDCARRYLERLRSWLPPGTARGEARMATSSERDAHEAIAAFRLTPRPSILVTVAMAYEGLDAPEVAVVAALTHIRSRAWLEQMIARATRVDPHAGPVEAQRALVFHPDDPLFAQFRRRVETEQGTLARPRRRRPTPDLPLWLAAEIAEGRCEREPGVVPLGSRSLGMRYATLRPGPEFAQARLWGAQDDAEGPAQDACGPEGEDEIVAAPRTPSRDERRLRGLLREAVARQVVEDEEAARRRGGGQLGFGSQANHRYNAVLKRVIGKARAEMSAAEMEAALGWIERNRLADHLDLLDGDPRYAWDVRRNAEGRARRGGDPAA